MDAASLLATVIAAFGSLLTALLILILQRISRLEDKLDAKQDKSFCGREHERVGHALQEISSMFEKHSHEGLSSASKVTR